MPDKARLLPNHPHFQLVFPSLTDPITSAYRDEANGGMSVKRVKRVRLAIARYGIRTSKYVEQDVRNGGRGCFFTTQVRQEPFLSRTEATTQGNLTEVTCIFNADVLPLVRGHLFGCGEDVRGAPRRLTGTRLLCPALFPNRI